MFIPRYTNSTQHSEVKNSYENVGLKMNHNIDFINKMFVIGYGRLFLWFENYSFLFGADLECSAISKMI